MTTVGIVGGSGFIGSFVTRRFLQSHDTVRVSVRDLANREKYSHLSAMDDGGKLEIVELDVQNKDALRRFVNGCDVVVHSGTPFQIAVDDPQRDMFHPTIRGTEHFLDVAAQLPRLRRVVFIASVAALNTNFPFPVPGRAADHVYTEADEPYHSPENVPYAQAKYFADQVVRKYIASHADRRFEIVSVCPTLVAGPALSTRSDSTSQGMQLLLKNRLAPDDLFKMLWDVDAEWAVVDVLDVAECVHEAATRPGVDGRWYLISGKSWTMSDMHRLLNDQPPAGSPRTVYSAALAERELGVQFASSDVPLKRFRQTAP